MNKAVQEAVQQRDGAVHPANAGDLSGVPWSPRTDGKRAILLSERRAVFDRKLLGLEAPDPVELLSDPIWRAKDGNGVPQWTPDLVHARLQVTGDTIRRLPPVVRQSYTCVLGRIAVTDMASPGPRRSPLTPVEITLADWTLVEIFERAHRKVLLASAFGYSGDRIAEQLKAQGMRISGSTVQALYLNERRILAGQWQGRRVPVDQLSFDRWQLTFQRRKK